MNYPPDTCVVLLSCSIYDMSINLNDSKADDTAFCGSEQTLSPPPERQGKRISWKVCFYLTCVLDRHHDVLTCQIQAIYIYPVARVEWYYEAEYLNKMFYTFLLHLLQPWHLLLQSI